MYDVIIIGGGWSGLSAAALLAKEGKKILLLEKTKFLGGRAYSYKESGFIWQYGQHAHRLNQDGIANQVFTRLGETLDFIDLGNEKAYFYFEGELFPSINSISRILTTKIMPFKARLHYIAFVSKLLRQNPDDWYDTTLLELHRLWYNKPEFESYLNLLSCLIMVINPGEVSAGEVIQFIKRAASAKIKRGEPMGGTLAGINKLHAVATKYGGEVHFSEPVQNIIIKKKRALGVKTAKKIYKGANIVFAMPLYYLFKYVKESDFSPQFVRYIKNIEPSRGLVIDFVFNEPVTDLKIDILGVDIPLWVKFQTAIDPTVAPQGKQVNSWGLLFEQDGPITKKTIKDTEMKIKQIMERLMPGSLAKVVKERTIIMEVINGNILKPKHSYKNRPDITSNDIKNLYFIGDTTKGLGCSGDIAFSSAMKLADLLR